MFLSKPIALVAATLIALPVPLVAAPIPATAQSTPAQKSQADRLLEQGRQQYRTSQVEAALRSWQQALELYRHAQDRSGQGSTLNNLGNAYNALGNYPAAIESYQQSLDIARNIHDRLGEGRALGNLGNAYYYLGNYSQAIEFYQPALAIAREVKNRLGESHTLNNLGNIFQSRGDFPRAIESYQRSLVIARDLKNRSSEGNALSNLGNAYQALGDYPTAISYYQQSLNIAREIKNRASEGSTLGNLGIVFQALGDYSAALEYHQRHLAIARETKDRLGEGSALGNLGNTYNSLADHFTAIEYHQQHLAIAQEIKDRVGEGSILGNLGNAYNALGNYPAAIHHYQQSLAVARELRNRSGEGSTLGNLGNAYNAMGNSSKAIEYYQQHLAIAQEIKDRASEGRALNNLGNAYSTLKHYPKAEAVLRVALQVWESLRPGLTDTNKISLFETQAVSYRLLQEVLVAQHKTGAALEIAERGRSRAFVELLAQRLQPRATIPAATQPPNLQQIQKIAKAQNATLVMYSTIGEQSLYLWVIQPTGKIAFRSVDLQASLPKGVSLEEYVRTVRSDSLGVRGWAPAAGTEATSKFSPLQDLHQLLIQPIASLLPTDPSQRVIFLPQGSLFLVPFAALRSTNGKYLIEQHTILTAPSIQVLELTRQKLAAREKGVGSLIVGNPTMPKIPASPGETPEQLPDLPGAEVEAKAIAQLLHTPFLTGNQATKAAVKAQMQQARLIHLATHGLLDDRRGIGSAIALAPSGNDNGLLTAEEILDLKLNADLVVLSACDTGRGKITGDGVIGLSRSLISAGAPSVIVSLWAVPDAPTSSLMTQFYQNLQKNPDKAQALRQAMLTTMQQHPNPRDWAAFTLIGEAE